MTAPRPLDPFLRFAQVLRGAGFAVSPDQTIDFIAAVGLLGPRGMTDIHQAGLALFAVAPERMAEYDALFRAVFLDQVLQAPASGEDEDEVVAHEPTGTNQEIEADEDESEIGAEPSGAERLGQRPLRSEGEAEALTRLAREAPAALPRRLSFRRRAARRGDRMDLRRSLREAVRRDGDVIELLRTRRKSRQRRLLLLIDVSGSMKDRSEASLRLAHAVVQAADRAEVFTLGTRLTRITAALRPADRAQALERAGMAIADIDGGTRIGEALHAYLSVPRYAGFARGAAVVILSDGLERGAPDTMVDAVARLSRIAWRVDLLSPLASDPDYRPVTAALVGVAPHLTALADGASTEAIADHILGMARNDSRRHG
ncbi:vWA domain-containing protein [Frigidibacter sp. ROC022]|uniref:vWA domain-containing protein n=1 Tax=Frigidibacter sp. ROC022 TaxID=2971796 RepID=UPI00215A50BB|nr:VWA domain-containing protein [Frigidibacter sp. ROC022]MCR8725764.1 VWA domain-containing protein [Frigidibacter sp. ROC022]